MKANLQSATRQKQPQMPGNAVNSPASTSKRTRDYIPGALLFMALLITVFYGAGSQSPSTVNAGQKANSQPSSANAAVPTTSDATAQNNPNQQSDQPAMDTPRTSGGNVSTSITNNNGKTTVTVNGEAVVTPQDGQVSKTITTDNGDNVQINVSKDSAQVMNSGSGSSYVNSFTSSNTSSWNYQSETTMGGN